MLNNILRLSCRFSQLSQKLNQQLNNQALTKDQLFQQFIYLKLVQDDIQNLKKKEKLKMLMRKKFMIVPHLYVQTTEQELKESLKQLNEEELDIKAETWEKELLTNKVIRNDLINCWKSLTFKELVNIMMRAKDLQPHKQLIMNLNKQFAESGVNSFDSISNTEVVKFFYCMKIVLEDYGLKDNFQVVQSKIVMYRLLNARVSKLSLNNLFTILGLDSQQEHSRNFFGLQGLKEILMELGTNLSQSVEQKVKLSVNDANDAKVLQSPDFYVQLIKFLGKCMCDSQEVGGFIEEMFLSQRCFQGVEKNRLKIYLILQHQLQQCLGGQKLLREINDCPRNSLERQLSQFHFHFLPSALYKLLQNDIATNCTGLYSKQYITEADLKHIRSRPFAWGNFLNALMRVMSDKLEESVDGRTQYMCQDMLIYLRSMNRMNMDLSVLERMGGQIQQKEEEVNAYVNELNTDVEEQLNTLGVTYLREHRLGSRICDYYLPQLNVVVECDGLFHYVPKTNLPRPQFQMRNYLFMSMGHQVMEINWFKWEEARHNGTKLQLIKESLDRLTNKSLLLIR